MIVDVPTEQDFLGSGTGFLNLAWGASIDLIMGLEEYRIAEVDADGTIADDYWARAQGPLSTAIALAQQGTEFLLKARIASVSPFLLLVVQPRDWPKGCELIDTPFADFRSLDAQDLVRVHEATSGRRLSAEFRGEFERMRRIRNSLVHTVNKRNRFSASEVLKWILRAHREFDPDRPWMRVRSDYLDMAHPDGAFYSEYGWANRVARELRTTVDVLKPAECLTLLGINKKQRFYYCVDCEISDFGLDSHVKTAQLSPNRSTSTTLYCHACLGGVEIERMSCKKCTGNVLDQGAERCLTCGNYQAESRFSESFDLSAVARSGDGRESH